MESDAATLEMHMEREDTSDKDAGHGGAEAVHGQLAV